MIPPDHITRRPTQAVDGRARLGDEREQRRRRHPTIPRSEQFVDMYGDKIIVEEDEDGDTMVARSKEWPQVARSERTSFRLCSFIYYFLVFNAFMAILFLTVRVNQWLLLNEAIDREREFANLGHLSFRPSVPFLKTVKEATESVVAGLVLMGYPIYYEEAGETLDSLIKKKPEERDINTEYLETQPYSILRALDRTISFCEDVSEVVGDAEVRELASNWTGNNKLAMIALGHSFAKGGSEFEYETLGLSGLAVRLRSMAVKFSAFDRDCDPDINYEMKNGERAILANEMKRDLYRYNRTLTSLGEQVKLRLWAIESSLPTIRSCSRMLREMNHHPTNLLAEHPLLSYDVGFHAGLLRRLEPSAATISRTVRVGHKDNQKRMHSFERFSRQYDTIVSQCWAKNHGFEGYNRYCILQLGNPAEISKSLYELRDWIIAANYTLTHAHDSARDDVIQARLKFQTAKDMGLGKKSPEN